MNLLNGKGITLKGLKSFLNYSSVLLLGQWVNNFRLLTLKEKIATIIDLSFLKNLKKLEHYLGLIG